MFPETAGSLLGMGVVGKSCVHIKILKGLKKKLCKRKMQMKMIILLQLQCHTWL